MKSQKHPILLVERPEKGSNFSAYANVVCAVAGRYCRCRPHHFGAFEPGLKCFTLRSWMYIGSGVLSLPYALKLGG